MSNSPFILRSGNLELDCRAPRDGGAHVMGILNVTPDSFFDGGKYLDPALALARAVEMSEEGARLIDIGGASSRPSGATYGEGAALISAAQELDRIIPVIECVSEFLPDLWISVDTFRSDVAREALAAGAHMINDITALRFDPNLAGVVSAAEVPLILMHSVGNPGEMPHVAKADDIVGLVLDELSGAREIAIESGCRQVLLDPGFGFGKSSADNLRLIAEIPRLVALGSPVLIGVSRKSTIGELVGKGDDIAPPDQRLAGSLAVTGLGVIGGAAIVRTHDVSATSLLLSALDATMRTGGN